MATLKDVAKLACVDVSTVSRALNNTSYVHPDTKAKIYAAAKELGYHPNIMAQALRQGRRHTIGVVVPRLHLAIFSEILQGIEEGPRGPFLERGFQRKLVRVSDNQNFLGVGILCDDGNDIGLTLRNGFAQLREVKIQLQTFFNFFTHN